ASHFRRASSRLMNQCAFVQALGSEFAIVGGLARSGEVEREPALISPQIKIAWHELGALVDLDHRRESLCCATASSSPGKAGRPASDSAATFPDPTAHGYDDSRSAPPVAAISLMPSIR